MATWVPTPAVIAWARHLVQSLKDGGVWAVPMNLSVYRIDKKAKVLALVSGIKDDVFDKNVVVFGQIGYQVKDERQLAAYGPQVFQGLEAQESLSPSGVEAFSA